MYLDKLVQQVDTLTEQGFDHVAVLVKLPEMVAVLVKLAERLEGRQLPLVVFPGDSLGNQILEAVEGIKRGEGK